jgi:hypothetical protein
MVIIETELDSLWLTSPVATVEEVTHLARSLANQPGPPEAPFTLRMCPDATTSRRLVS